MSMVGDKEGGLAKAGPSSCFWRLEMKIDLWQLTIYQAACLKAAEDQMLATYGWKNIFDFWNGGYVHSPLFWGES